MAIGWRNDELLMLAGGLLIRHRHHPQSAAGRGGRGPLSRTPTSGAAGGAPELAPNAVEELMRQ